MVSTQERRKAMRDLEVGDKVLALSSHGQLFYDEIYAFGHKANGSTFPFVEVVLSASKVLHLSAGHYIPIAHDANQPWAKAEMKRAQDVRVGEWVWAMTEVGGRQVTLSQVLSVSIKYKQGLYNPFTMSGTIVVDGVLTSAHSEWMLDDITPAALVRFLPSVYQGLLSPARLLYRLMEPDKMRAFDDKYGVKSEDHISFSGYVSVLATAVQVWLTPDKPAGKGAREAL